MKRIHIVGGKNHGKTTLVEQLIQSYRQQGYRVGAIKHTHHQHELDTPGKDSHRHREAGASVVGIITRSMDAVFLPPPVERQAEADTHSREQQYQRLAPMFEECDLVLVEGDLKTSARRVEVWRRELGTPPIASGDSTILAVVSDDEANVNVPTWSRSDVNALSANLLKLFSDDPPPG